MDFDEISSRIAGVPFIKPRAARGLYEFILEHRPKRCLELGFAHGASSCYIAAALEEVGDGHLESVDLLSSADLDPTLEDLLDRTGLGHYVTVSREVNSYNWWLKKRIEERTSDGVCQPQFDFCFIDGSKNWTIDGFAFFLADKLLNVDGWILFDDYDWTYEGTGRQATDGVSNRDLSDDQRQEPNIRLVFQNLVMQHPDYSRFRIQDETWAWAQKVRGSAKVVTYDSQYSLTSTTVAALKRLKRRLT